MNKTCHILAALVMLTACQTQPVANVSTDDFQVQAITRPYLSRKVDRWLATHQGNRLLRELQYAQTKYPALMQQVVATATNPSTYYQSIRNNSTVSTYRSNNPTFNTFTETLDPNPILSSCKAIYDRNNSTDRISGIKTIDLDGSGPQPQQQVYCDQEHDGGGWTMIVAQFESNPITNWNQGRPAGLNYDPSLATSKSFVLNTEQIPPHTHTAFGKGLNATFVDYVPYVYTTGNLAVSGLLTSPRAPGKKYYIHRSTALHYSYHDVFESAASTSQSDQNWNNTLSFDQTGGQLLTWSFSPLQTPPLSRGFGMLGAAHSTNETFAWTVWVR